MTAADLDPAALKAFLRPIMPALLKGMEASLAARARTKNFSADGDDDAPESDRFTRDDLAKFADYFTANEKGHYPGNVHRTFACGVKHFAATLGMTRMSPAPGEWVWVKKAEPKQPDTFAAGPGKELKEVTDKNGNKVHRWVSTGSGEEHETHPDTGEHADAARARRQAEHFERESMGRVNRFLLDHATTVARIGTVATVLDSLMTTPEDILKHPWLAGKFGTNSTATGDALGDTTGVPGHLAARLVATAIAKGWAALRGKAGSQMSADAGELDAAAELLAGLANAAAGRDVATSAEVRAWLDTLAPDAETFADEHEPESDTDPVLEALLDYTIAAKEAGEDPTAGIEFLREHIGTADPQQFSDAACFASRHKDGDTWVTGSRKYTRANGKTTWESTTKRDEGGGSPGGEPTVTQQRAAAKERGAALLGKLAKASDLRGKLTADDLHEIADHLADPAVTVAQLREVRRAMRENALKAGFGGNKRKEEMVAALVQHAREHALGARMKEQGFSPEEAAAVRDKLGAGKKEQPAPAPKEPAAPAPEEPKAAGGKTVPAATRPALTEDERKAIGAYTNTAYKSMNAQLRDGKPLSAENAATHAAMQAAFKKAKPFIPPQTVRRAVNLDGPLAEQFAALAQEALAGGKVATMPGYVSTTRGDFASDLFKHAAVNLTINAVHGLDVSGVSASPGEQEMLLNDGSRFRVKAVTRVGDGWHVEMDQLPPDAAGAPEVSLAVPSGQAIDDGGGDLEDLGGFDAFDPADAGAKFVGDADEGKAWAAAMGSAEAEPAPTGGAAPAPTEPAVSGTPAPTPDATSPEPSGVTLKTKYAVMPDKRAASDAASEKIIGGMSPGRIGALVGAPDGAAMTATYDPTEGVVEVEANGDGVTVTRKIGRDADGNLTVRNEHFKIDDDSPHKGKGIAMFRQQVEALAAAGVKSITTTAKGGPDNPDYYGYKVWPKVGYNGPIPDDVAANLPPDLKAAVGGKGDMASLMAAPGGPEWWAKNGHEVDLTFDPSPGSDSRNRLDAYLAGKSKTAPAPASGVPSASAAPAPPATAPTARRGSQAGRTGADDANPTEDEFEAASRPAAKPAAPAPAAVRLLDAGKVRDTHEVIGDPHPTRRAAEDAARASGVPGAGVVRSMGQWAVAAPKAAPETPAPEPDAAAGGQSFIDAVHAAAREAPDGVSGDAYDPRNPDAISHKPFISSVYDRMRQAGTLPADVTLDEFKRRLLAAQGGGVNLARNDLPQIVPPHLAGEIARSHAPHPSGSADFHTILTPRESVKPAQVGALPPPAAPEPAAPAKAPAPKPPKPTGHPGLDAALAAHASAPTPLVKAALDAALHNAGVEDPSKPPRKGLPKGTDDRKLARTLTGAYLQLRDGGATPEELAHMEGAMRAHGIEPVGAAGDAVRVDGRYHQPEQGHGPNDPATVRHPGWVHRGADGQEYLLHRAALEKPGAK